MDKNLRVIGSYGILCMGRIYWHPALAPMIGACVEVQMSKDNKARIYQKDGTFVCEAEPATPGYKHHDPISDSASDFLAMLDSLGNIRTLPYHSTRRLFMRIYRRLGEILCVNDEKAAQ